MTEHHRCRDLEERQFGNLHYLRYADGKHRGTVRLLDESGRAVREIRSFPHINRVYRLSPGLRKQFGSGPFFAEEKMDGYNVRFFHHGGAVYAMTRGGFVCPFTTEWTRIWDEHYGITGFFAKHPELVLCGEVCGDTPYHCQRDPSLPPGAHLFVFDVLQPDGRFLPPAERYDLLDGFGLPSVPRYGRFTAEHVDQIGGLMRDLNERQREGMVFTSPRTGQVKFVTPNSDLGDIRHALSRQFDLEFGFFRNRLLRSVLFVDELGLDRQEYERRLGEAFFEGLVAVRALPQCAESGVVYVRRYATWQATAAMIRGRPVRVVTDGDETVQLEGRRMIKVRFRRVFRKSTDRYRSILHGFPHTD